MWPKIGIMMGPKKYIIKAIFSVLLLLQSVEAIAVSWKINNPNDALFLENQVSGAKVTTIRSKTYTITVIEKENKPESINSIKKRIEEVQGLTRTLQIIPMQSGKGSVFHFSSKEASYFFSTLGGSLTIYSSGKEIPNLTSIVSYE